MNRLKNIFSKAAQDNCLVRGFINNSERISSLGYLSGNIILLTKQGLDVNFATLSGAFFLCNAACLFFAGNRPAFMKAAGASTMGGALALGAAGIGEPGAASQMIGIVPIILSGYLMTRNSIETLADKAKELKQRGGLSSAFNKASSFVKKTPLVLSGLLGLSATPFLMFAAIQQSDIWLGVVSVAWIIAGSALSASDPAVKAIASNDDHKGNNNNNNMSSPAQPLSA